MQTDKYFIAFLMDPSFTVFINSFETRAKEYLSEKEFIRRSDPHITLKPPFEIDSDREDFLIGLIEDQYYFVDKKPILVQDKFEWFQGVDPEDFFYVMTFKNLIAASSQFRTSLSQRIEAEFPGIGTDDILGAFHTTLGIFTKDEKSVLIQNAFSFASPPISKIENLALFKKDSTRWKVIKKF